MESGKSKHLPARYDYDSVNEEQSHRAAQPRQSNEVKTQKKEESLH
jgi:hypothetical protein